MGNHREVASWLSVRGPGGGYQLARAPATVSVADVIVAVDEPIDATQCGGLGDCHNDGHPCMTHELWTGLNAHIYQYLESVDLAKLVSGQMACQEKEAKRHAQRVLGSAELKTPDLKIAAHG